MNVKLYLILTSTHIVLYYEYVFFNNSKFHIKESSDFNQYLSLHINTNVDKFSVWGIVGHSQWCLGYIFNFVLRNDH